MLYGSCPSLLLDFLLDVRTWRGRGSTIGGRDAATEFRVFDGNGATCLLLTHVVPTGLASLQIVTNGCACSIRLK